MNRNDYYNLEEIIEKEFVRLHNIMDENIRKDPALAKACATSCCTLTDILAQYKGTSTDGETERIYNKYNLWKIE